MSLMNYKDGHVDNSFGRPGLRIRRSGIGAHCIRFNMAAHAVLVAKSCRILRQQIISDGVKSF